MQLPGVVLFAMEKCMPAIQHQSGNTLRAIACKMHAAPPLTQCFRRGTLRSSRHMHHFFKELKNTCCVSTPCTWLMASNTTNSVTRTISIPTGLVHHVRTKAVNLLQTASVADKQEFGHPRRRSCPRASCTDCPVLDSRIEKYGVGMLPGQL